MLQIHERIRQQREKAGLSQKELAEIIGVERTTYAYWEEVDPKPDKIKMVAKALNLPDEFFFVNVEYEDEEKPYIKRRRELKNGDTGRQVPFYDTFAVAGKEYGANMEPVIKPSGTVDVGDFLRDSKAAMRVYGNSMIPGYPPGCIIGLVENTDYIIHPGHTYVIETTNNRYVKRLYYTETKDEFLLVSDNIAQFEAGPMKGNYFYPPFPVAKKDIKRLYDVTGVIKRNKNTMILKEE